MPAAWGKPCRGKQAGGGALVGAATPNIDRLAREGLELTSTYALPTCTPPTSARSSPRSIRPPSRPILVWDGRSCSAARNGYTALLIAFDFRASVHQCRALVP
jgi:hypothetical protein